MGDNREPVALANVCRSPRWSSARLKRAFLRWFSYSPASSVMSQLWVFLFLKGTPLLALLIVGRRSWKLGKLFRRSRKPFCLFLLRTAFEFWWLLELLFWFYFHFKKRQLEGRRAYHPSVLRKAAGERMALLRNFLLNAERIHSGRIEGMSRSDSKGSLADAPRRTSSAFGIGGFASLTDAIKPLPKQLSHKGGDTTVEDAPLRHCSQTGLRGRARQKSCAGRRQSEVRLFGSPSVENFLRYAQDAEDEATTHGAWYGAGPVEAKEEGDCDAGPGAWYLQRGANQGSKLAKAPSVENLLRCWQKEDSCRQRGSSAEDALAAGIRKSSQSRPEILQRELECLKHLELCSWFSVGPRREPCRDVHAIQRGNIEEWLLSYWFDGADSIHALTAEEVAELQELTAEVVRWAGLTHLEAPNDCSFSTRKKNDDLRCFRLRNDPFPAVHRPLATYMLTAFFAPLFGHRVLLSLGFRPYRSGSTEYWLRPPCPDAAWVSNHASPHRPQDLTAGPQAWHRPLVFCHGIGVGPTMCLKFLQQLISGLGEEYPIFLVDTAAISMRFADDVPCAREVAANMVNMLEVWGFKTAHFVGHSFGSFLVAWMLRYQRDRVDRCTFMDPVCFLLLKVLADAHQLQQLRHTFGMNTMEIGIKYFVMTELFVCNFMCRCFFWEESQLNMCDLEGLKALVVLESDDKIVPSHSVRLLTWQEQHRRASSGLRQHQQPEDTGLEILWVEGQPHAGFLVDAEANLEVNNRLRAFHGLC